MFEEVGFRQIGPESNSVQLCLLYWKYLKNVTMIKQNSKHVWKPKQQNLVHCAVNEIQHQFKINRMQVNQQQTP